MGRFGCTTATAGSTWQLGRYRALRYHPNSEPLSLVRHALEGLSAFQSSRHNQLARVIRHPSPQVKGCEDSPCLLVCTPTSRYVHTLRCSPRSAPAQTCRLLVLALVVVVLMRVLVFIMLMAQALVVWRRSGPERGVGQRKQAVPERDGVGSCVEDDPDLEAVLELVTERDEVPEVLL